MKVQSEPKECMGLIWKTKMTFVDLHHLTNRSILLSRICSSDFETWCDDYTRSFWIYCLDWWSPVASVTKGDGVAVEPLLKCKYIKNASRSSMNHQVDVERFRFWSFILRKWIQVCYYLRQGYVFVSICLSVCLFVCKITRKGLNEFWLNELFGQRWY